MLDDLCTNIQTRAENSITTPTDRQHLEDVLKFFFRDNGGTLRGIQVMVNDILMQVQSVCAKDKEQVINESHYVITVDCDTATLL